MEKKKVTDAQKRATAKYEKENYDKILVRLPKGTKEKIMETGAKSANSYIVDCVLTSLNATKYNSELAELQRIIDEKRKNMKNKKDF